MAVTLFHKIIHNNKITIINEAKEPKKQVEQIFADMKSNKHIVKDIKRYDKRWAKNK